MDQLLEPSKRNDKSLNQVNDLNKNCTLKRHSDVNNSATNSHIELDNNRQAHPKTPTDLPNRFSSIGISDHCLVYAIRKICIPKSNPKTVTSRCFRNFTPDSFRTDLSMVPWHLIEQEHNPDIAWDIWQHMFLDLLIAMHHLRRRE